MAYIVVSCGGKEMHRAVLEGVVLFGRSIRCSVFLDDPAVSREHCKIVRDGKGWVVVDLDSRNGTVVGGEKVSKRVLVNGDVVRVGGSEIEFHAGAFKRGRAVDPGKDQMERLMGEKPGEEDKVAEALARTLPKVGAEEAGVDADDTQTSEFWVTPPNTIAFQRAKAKPIVKGQEKK